MPLTEPDVRILRIRLVSDTSESKVVFALFQRGSMAQFSVSCTVVPSPRLDIAADPFKWTSALTGLTCQIFRSDQLSYGPGNLYRFGIYWQIIRG